MIAFLMFVGITLVTAALLITAILLSIKLGLLSKYEIELPVILSTIPGINVLILFLTFPLVTLIFVFWMFNITGDKIDSLFDKLEE